MAMHRVHETVTSERPRPKRAGVSLVEILASTSLLAVLLGTVLPVLTALDRIEGDAAQRRLAMQELDNHLQRLVLAEWEGQLQQELDAIEPSSLVRDRLTEPRIETQFQRATAAAAGDEVRLTLHWQDGPESMRSVSLSSWFFGANGGESEEAGP